MLGSIFVKNLSRRSFLRPLETRFIFDAGVSISTEAPILKNQQQWRSYTKYIHHQFNKLMDSRASQSSYLSRRSYTLPTSSSSSSSSSSKYGFLRWYLGMLDSHPLTTKAVTASLIYAAADLTSQALTLPPSGSFDSMRTLRMAAYGLVLLGPSQHLWFNFVSRILPKRDTLTTLKKILLGQTTYGPCITTIFFSYNAALQGESGDEIVAKLQRDLIPTLISGLVYWPMCDFLTFKFVPVHLQSLINSSFSYLWTIYLTYMATLKMPTD